MQSERVKKIIVERAQTRQRADRAQLKLVPDADLWHETIVGKLWPLNDSTQVANFTRCGHEEIFRTCKHCGQTERFFYQCSLKWCPRCQWKITARRQAMMNLWAKRIRQPKHLVTTQSNFPVLTRRVIRLHQRNIARFRRLKCFRNVRGGCVSTEVTNEGRGWHLHAHWLLDADWLPMADVSVGWAKQVGQAFAIVKVKDVRATNYAAEVCKYLAKGSEIAGWPPEHINEFVRAIRGCRFFGSFGSLRELAPQIRAEIAAQKPPPPVCECGKSEFSFRTEVAELLRELAH